MNYFEQRKIQKRKDKIDFYSAIALIAILTISVLIIELVWILKINQ